MKAQFFSNNVIIIYFKLIRYFYYHGILDISSERSYFSTKIFACR